MNSLPRKNLLFVGVPLFIIVVGLVFVYSQRQNNESGTEAPLLENFADAASEHLATADSDRDTLYDWEEGLWHTDPHNPDTDNDGINDGEEIRQNRDPRIPGPHDELDETLVLVEEDAFTEDSVNPSVTDTFSQELFTQYINMRQGGVLDEQAREVLINSSLGKLGQEAVLARYTLSDLSITPKESVSVIRAYGNALGLAINTNSIQNENEARILLRALENEDEEELKKLDDIIAVYQNTAADALVLITPESATLMHLDLINSFVAMAEIIIDMRTAFIDPFASLVAISAYQDTVESMLEAFIEAEHYFSEKGVEFSINEPGYTVTHIIQ